MGARDIALADETNILEACILGYFSMVWPAHVVLRRPPLIHRRVGSLGFFGKNPTKELCRTGSGAGELSSNLASYINFFY